MNTQSVNTSLYQKGDISLERIYGKYRNSFIRYAGKVLSDEFYAEDVVQDVFTGLFLRSVIQCRPEHLIMHQMVLC